MECFLVISISLFIFHPLLLILVMNVFDTLQNNLHYEPLSKTVSGGDLFTFWSGQNYFLPQFLHRYAKNTDCTKGVLSHDRLSMVCKGGGVELLSSVLKLILWKPTCHVYFFDLWQDLNPVLFWFYTNTKSSFCCVTYLFKRWISGDSLEPESVRKKFRVQIHGYMNNLSKIW